MFSKRSVDTPRLIMITTSTNMTYHEYQGMFDIALFFKKTKGLFIWEAERDVCRGETFFIPALKTVYMRGGRVVFYRFKNCLYGRWDGMV